MIDLPGVDLGRFPELLKAGGAGLAVEAVGGRGLGVRARVPFC